MMEQHFFQDKKTSTTPGVENKVLVTGANGQLGKELQQLAAQQSLFTFIFLSKEELPIDRLKSISNALKTHRPGYFINCAAYTAVDRAESEKDEAFLVNAEAPAAIASVCKEMGCRLIHISTDYVFDGTATVPYNEEAATNPQTVYGASKAAGEKMVLEADPSAIIIRTSWVYSEFGKNFVKTMLKLMSEKEEINVVNDQYGSPTYAADLAAAILQIIHALSTHHSPLTTDHSPLTTPHLYHFSNSGIITWYDFALAIKELSGSKCKVNPIPTSSYPTPAKRPHYSVLDKTKIQQTFGIVLKDWKDSLATCLQRIKSTS